MKNIKNTYIQEDDSDFDELFGICGRSCKRDREKKASEQGRQRDIAKYTKSTYAIIPEFYNGITSFASSLGNYSANEIASFRVELNKLWSKAENDKFRGGTPTSSTHSKVSGYTIKGFINERTPIFRAHEEKLKAEKDRVSEREATRKELFTKLAVAHPWAVRPVNSSILSKLGDTEIEDSLMVLEEYILFESNPSNIKIYESRVDALIREQKTRGFNLEDETNESDNESDNESVSTIEPINEEGSDLKGSLMKYKWYIGGALLVSVVGLIVIKKL